MIGAKSPLTGGFSGSEAGGFFGAELKRTGWDAIIIEGVSPSPVYLWIRDDHVELRSAAHLLGLETADVEERLREELGERHLRVSQCGPAGERLVRISNVMHDATRAAGRTGLGAVMGSKKLKAVVVRGSRRPPVADQGAVADLARWFRDNYQQTGSAAYHTLGTVRLVRVHQEAGGLPTRNFQQGVFDGFEKLSAETMLNTITIGRDTCFGCPIRCKWVVEVKSDTYPVDPRYGGPEYEAVGSMGSLCGVDNLEMVAYGNQLCNANGLDTIGAGSAIAFAMECYERGLLTKEDTGGLDLRFGNAEAVIEMIRRIIRREGLGDVLAEGSLRAAKRIGKGAERYAMQIKGQEVAMHDPRIKYGHGLGIAVSPTGADHMNSVHDNGYTSRGGIAALEPFGIIEPLPFDDLSTDKARMMRYAMMWRILDNLTGFCMFQAWSPQQKVDIIRAATGWDTGLTDLWLAAERAYDMARAFNTREGFTPEDDMLHPRFFEHLPEGPVAGKSPTEAQYRATLAEFYEMMGWDTTTGAPTRGKLLDLGISWVADMLEKAEAT